MVFPGDFHLISTDVSKTIRRMSFEYKFYGAKKGNCLTRFI